MAKSFFFPFLMDSVQYENVEYQTLLGAYYIASRECDQFSDNFFIYTCWIKWHRNN